MSQNEKEAMDREMSRDKRRCHKMRGRYHRIRVGVTAGGEPVLGYSADVTDIPCNYWDVSQDGKMLHD